MVLKRRFLSAIIIGVLALVILFFAVTLGFYAFRCAKIDKEVAAKTETIDRFVQRSKMPLTDDSVSFLLDERNKLKSAYSRLRLALTSPLSEDIPEENLDPLKFKEILIQTQKKLREEAKEFSLALPESLGFTKYETELSESWEIPGLWRRLKTLEELVYIITLSGVRSLDEINFTGDDLKKEEALSPKVKAPAEVAPRKLAAGPAGRMPDIPMPIGEAPKKEEKEGVKTARIYDEIIVSFKITCTYSELVDFLYRLRTSPFIFVVDDLDMTKAKDSLDKDEAAEGIIQANFLVKAEIIR